MMALKDVFIFLVSLFATAICVDFEQYVSVQQKTIANAVVNFTTTQHIWCIQGCRSIAGCKSVSYSAVNATCVIHDEHPVQEDAELVESTAFTLYYNYSCPSGWYLFRGKCYLFASFRLSWYDSKVYCANIGGTFVKIDSAEEQDFIEGVAETVYLGNSAVQHNWIGGFYKPLSGKFLWHDQTNIQYYGWGGSNPNINAGCIDIARSLNWKWNDHVDCNSLIEFICEKDLRIQ